MPKRMQDLPEEYLLYKHTLATDIGVRIRMRRIAMNLTQDQVRAKMEFQQVAMSRAQYSRIENGESMPNVVELIALHMVLEISLDWLILGKT